MSGSPAICSANLVQRAQETQRSRSSSTSLDSATGLAKVRLVSVNRDSPRPLDMAWFCSGHSPPLSHMGQSSGWLMRSISITPACALSATCEVSWVRTFIPSVQVVVHDASGLAWPSTSTRHCRQAPTGSSNGWSQNRGIWIPSSSAARITSMPLGTLISKPSMVTVTRCSTGARAPASVCAVIRSLTSVGPYRRGGGIERAAAALEVLDELVPEVLDGGHHGADRAVAERAERAPEDVVTDVEQLVQVRIGAHAPVQPVEDADHPVGPLPARGALAAGLVLVELGPPERGADHAGGVVEDLQRPGAEHGARRADALEVQRHVEVLVGEDRRGRPAGRPELQRVPGPDTAGQVEEFPQGDAEWRLVLARRGHVPGQREDAEPLGLLGAQRRERRGAVPQEVGHAGDRLHVVDHGGAGVEAGDGRERRLEPRLPAE